MDFLLIGVGLIIASACLLMYAGYYARKMEAEPELDGDSGSTILDINGNFVALQFAESRKKEGKEVSACEKCKNPDERQLGCPDWVFFGEKHPYRVHYFSYIWAEGQNIVPINKKEKN